MEREEHLDRFYSLLKELEEKLGGKRKLKDCHGRMDWPQRGIYFFFSSDETRDDCGSKRVTRVGTHALKEGSNKTLWARLREHRGYNRGSFPGGGNQRASIFRRIVGEAIIHKEGLEEIYPEWSKGSSAPKETRKQEYEMEKRVSEYIRELPFLWLKVNDEPGQESDRGYLERNSIALLSNYNKPSIDQRSENWLGQYSPKDKIKSSGLWNSNHVDESYEPEFLDVLEEYVEEW
ncbi:MAG: hypothetical protein ACOC8Y_06020 [Candidatus Natronoplasma sp.]